MPYSLDGGRGFTAYRLGVDFRGERAGTRGQVFGVGFGVLGLTGRHSALSGRENGHVVV